MFVPNPIIGLLGLIVLPIIIFYFNKFRGRFFLIYMILSISFLGSPIELLIGINTNFIEIILEILILLILLVTIFNNQGFYLKHVLLAAIFVLLCLLSFFINDVSWIQLIIFLRKYLIFILIFWITDNLDDYYQLNKLIKLFSTLFIFQILINILRFPITGVSEEYIGSLAVRGGSHTAIISLLGASFSFAYYLYQKNKKYLLLLIGFFIFAMIGEKRIVVMVLPLVLVAQYILYLVKERRLSSMIYKAPILLIAVLLFIYVGVRISPTLNPENEIGGSFDFYFLTEYIYDYSNPGKKVMGARYYGRGEAPLAVYNLLTNKYGLGYVLFGLGPGDIMMSRYIKQKDRSIKRVEDISASKYDIGYGARTGILFTTLQIGAIGSILFLLLIIRIYSYCLKICFYHFSDKFNNALSLSIFVSFFIFLIDFFTYSRVFYESIPIMFSILIGIKFIELNYRMENVKK